MLPGVSTPTVRPTAPRLGALLTALALLLSALPAPDAHLLGRDHPVKIASGRQQFDPFGCAENNLRKKAAEGKDRDQILQAHG